MLAHPYLNLANFYNKWMNLPLPSSPLVLGSFLPKLCLFFTVRTNFLSLLTFLFPYKV